MTEKKSDILKNILINLGVLFVLVGATAIKGDLSFFFIGLVLLAFQTFDFPAVETKKLVIAEIILAATLAIDAVTQLINANAGRTQQVFLVILLLGALLIVVESARKYADL
jgi:hypothetical protein